jgi:hypothetical protein
MGWLNLNFFKKTTTSVSDRESRFVDIGYPPSPQGFPVVSVDDLLRSPNTNQLIRRFRDAMPFKDEQFNELVMPTLVRFIEAVHLIPASEDHHHRFCGGLLAHSLEVAHLSAQFSNAKVFERTSDPELKREREPRWHAAAGIAGLLHDVGKISYVRVVNADGSQEWDFSSQISLVKWAKTNNISWYYVTFRPGRQYEIHNRLAATMFDLFVTEGLRAWLGVDMRLQIADAIVGGAKSLLKEFPERADQISCDRDLKSGGLLSDTNRRGVRVEQYLLKIFVELIADKVWEINGKGARLWYVNLQGKGDDRGETGLFIAWAKGYEEVISRVIEQQIPAVVRGADKLARFLVHDVKVAEPFIDREGEIHDLWVLSVPGATGGKSVNLRCLRLKSGAHHFNTISLPTAVNATVLHPNEIAPKVSAEASPSEQPGAGQAAPPPKKPGYYRTENAREMTLEETVEESLRGMPPYKAPNRAPHVEPDPPFDEEPPTMEEDGRWAPDDGTEEEDPRRVEPAPPPDAAIEPAGAHKPKFVSEKVQQTMAMFGMATDPGVMARERLEKFGDAGNLLLHLVALDRKKDGQTILLKQGMDVVIAYPGPLRQACGWKKQNNAEVTDLGGFIQVLNDRAFLHVDPASPRQFIRTVGEATGLLLVPQIGELVLAVLDAPPRSESEPTGPTTLEAKSPPVVEPKPKPERRKKPAAPERQDWLTGTAPAPAPPASPAAPVPLAPRHPAFAADLDDRVKEMLSSSDLDDVVDVLHQAGQLEDRVSTVTYEQITKLAELHGLKLATLFQRVLESPRAEARGKTLIIQARGFDAGH